MNYESILTAPATATRNNTQDYASMIIGGVKYYTQEVILHSADGTRRLSVRLNIALDGSEMTAYCTLSKKQEMDGWYGQWKDTKFYNCSAYAAQKLIDKKVKEFGL